MAITRNVSVTLANVNSNSDLSQKSSGFVSDEIRLFFQWMFFTVISDIIDIFGVVANIINIICFLKLGLQDSVNVSLLGLAVSDLGCLLSVIWSSICFNPAFNEVDLPFEPIEIQYLSGSGPHIIFTRVTSCITAFITMERCLCITIPLKVKRIFTPKRVGFFIIIIFITVIGNMIPAYFVSLMGVKFSTRRNKTVMGLIFTENRETAEAVSFAAGGLLFQINVFVAVVVCTVTLVVKLRGKTKWRQMSTSLGQTDSASARDQKVTRMVVVISTFFIFCFIPTCLTLIAMVIEPEFSIDGEHRNLFVCVFSVSFVLESTNSATNIFIYYHMSSKYRQVIQGLFPRSRGEMK